MNTKYQENLRIVFKMVMYIELNLMRSEEIKIPFDAPNPNIATKSKETMHFHG